MNRNYTLNMTEGRPLVLLSTFALPLLIGNMFQQAYNLADSMIVGRLLGANALAAVGATGSISFLFFSIFNGISSGCGIVTSQYFGAKDDEKLRFAITNSAYIILSFSLVTGLTAFLMVPIVLSWMGTPPEILPDAIVYMRMTAASAPLVAIYNYASSMQRALGDSRTPLYFLVVSCIINIALDLFFIGMFGMGVFGAALATMLSQLLAGIGSMLYAYNRNPYFHVRRKYLEYNPLIIRRALRLGLPLSLQWSLIAISTTALQTVVNSFGAVAMASYTATVRLEQLVQQPFGSLSMALSTYSGQNMGGGKMQRIRMGFWDSMLATLFLAGGLTLIMQVFGDNLVALFVQEPSVISLGGQALRITSIFYAFLGLIYVARGVLNGVGDTFFSLLNGIVEIVGRAGFPLLLRLIPQDTWSAFEHFLGLQRGMVDSPPESVWAIWITAGLTWMLSGLFCILRYFSWKKQSIYLQIAHVNMGDPQEGGRNSAASD